MRKTLSVVSKSGTIVASVALLAALAGCGGDGGGGPPVFVPVAVPVAAAPPPPAPVDPVPPDPLPALGPLFEEQRADMLKQLAPPILDCLPRVDDVNPKSPMFHGCVDWHSAVHAAYSLYAIHRHTGDRKYLEAVEAVLRPELVQQELAYMTNMQGTTGDSGVFGNIAEDFYGLSWFLALAKERELATGNKDFRPLGDAAAKRIKELVARLTPEEIELRTVTYDRAKFPFESYTAHNYANLPWALVHLKLWGDWVRDESLSTFAKNFVASNLMKPEFDQSCPVSNDAGRPDEFFAPCLMRLAAVARVLGSEQTEWLKARVPDSFYVEPINVTSDSSWHMTAQNWSRSFALWWIHQTTNQKTLRAMAIRLLGDQLLYRDRWDKQFDYMLSHWIAQFAVRMIDATYEPNAPLEGAQEMPLQIAAGDAWALGGQGLAPDANAYGALLNKTLASQQGGPVRYVNNAKSAAMGFDDNRATIQNLVEKRLPYLLELIAAYQRDPSEKVRNPRAITVHEGYEVGFAFLKPSTRPENLQRYLVLQEIDAIRSTEGDWVVVRAYLQSIVSQLKAAAPKSPIVLGTYDNPYRACKLAEGAQETRQLVDDYLEGGGRFAKGLNDVIREVARDNGVQVAEVYGKLAPEDWSTDCDLPNASGQKKLAEAFLPQIRID
ncbi:DUF2891 family protein [Variovorax sp.]|jgi:hypothetical protein|uniref:DUF2891 family protein n=1 Tax=Variovorax sp. TaxID=1871043 RepID=UPI0037D9B1FC